MAPLPHPSPTRGQKPQAVLARLSSSSETIGSGSPRTHQHPGPALALPLASLAACCSHRAVTHGCLQPHCGPEHAHPSQRCSPQHVPPSARHSGAASRPRWQHPVCRITPVLAFLPPLSQCVPASSPRCVTLSCLCPSRTGGLAHAEAPRDHLWMCPRCLLSHGQEQTALCLHPRVWQPELAQPERFGDGAHSTGGGPTFPCPLQLLPPCLVHPALLGKEHLKGNTGSATPVPPCAAATRTGVRDSATTRPCRIGPGARRVLVHPSSASSDRVTWCSQPQPGPRSLANPIPAV